MVHEKNIIQLIKSYLQQGHCVGVLSFLLMVPAPRTEVVQCHWGDAFRREGGIIAGRGRWGEFCCPKCGTGRDTRLGEYARRSLRRGWGSRGFVSSVGLEPMLNGIPPLCPAVSHPAVLSLRAWDMLTWGDTAWKNLRLSWKDAKPSQFQGAKITRSCCYLRGLKL